MESALPVRNTIMVDNCRHNFLMNPRNGLRVRCFRDAHTNQVTDRELVELCQYLMGLVGVASLEEVEKERQAVAV